MNSIHLIKTNLRHSEEIVLARIEDMRQHALVFPTVNGGSHTLWILGHLAFIEAQVIEQFMRGKENPLAHWEAPFDGDDVSGNADAFPSFDDTLRMCRERRERTLAYLNNCTEDDLDRVSTACPPGVEDLFGTYRACFQYVANHWFMHRGQLADARRAAGIHRMWF